MNRESTNDALRAVWSERVRQSRLKADGKFRYGPDDAELSDCEFLTVLAEEVGEVSHEINECIGHPERVTRQQRQRLRDELIQVAAVAVGRVELLDRQIADGMQYGEPDPVVTDWFAVGPQGAD